MFLCYKRTLSKPSGFTKGHEWSWMSFLITSGSSLDKPRQKYPSVAKAPESHLKMMALRSKIWWNATSFFSRCCRIIYLESILLLLKVTPKSTSSTNCIFWSKIMCPCFKHTMMQGTGWWKWTVDTKADFHIALWPKHKHASNYSQKMAETYKLRTICCK